MPASQPATTQPAYGQNYGEQPSYTQTYSDPPAQYGQSYAQPPAGYTPPLPFFQQETLGSWLVTIILTSIGGIIWLAILGFSSIGSEAKKNYAKASLIIMVIALAFILILSMTVGFTIFNATNG